MDSTLAIAIVSAIGTVIVGLITYLQNNAAKTADKNSSDFRELIDSLKTELAVAKSERAEAIEAREAALQDAREARDERTALSAQVNDQRELIEDYRDYQSEFSRWTGAGSVPPPPGIPWRLRQDLEAFLKDVDDILKGK